MSKRWRFLPVCLCLCLLTACSMKIQGDAPGTSSAGQSAGQRDDVQSSVQEDTPDPQEAEDLPSEQPGNAWQGTYTVPEGWVKYEAYSSDDMIFYVEQGHEDDSAPDNISINIGTNRYAAEDHESFRDAIVRQLTMQIKDSPDIELNGTGTHTEQGYVEYIFTIKESDGVVTEQRYIVGDNQFCLIQMTNYTGSESAVMAAKEMADSFVWTDA